MSPSALHHDHADRSACVACQADLAEAVRRATLELNAQINGACDLGLRVEIEVLPVQRFSERWARPHLVTTVTQSVAPATTHSQETP